MKENTMTSKKELAKAKRKVLYALSYYLTTKAAAKYAKAKFRHEKRAAKLAALKLSAKELAKLAAKNKALSDARSNEQKHA